jgi:hypothetical protein
LVADRHALAADFATWRVSAEHNETTARSVGLEVVRVLIQPDVFLAWCAERDLEPNATARTQYAEEVARTSDSS